MIGLILALLTILLTSTIFATNHIKMVKKLFTNYWFYAITAVIALIYFISLRWIWDLQDWINGKNLHFIKSKVLLLDMCPFLAVAMSITMLIDRNRKFLPILACFAIVGAGITIFGQIMFEQVGPNGSNLHLQNITWWEYTFFNQLYFMMHFYIFIIAWITILNSPSFNWSRILSAHLYAITYFLYVSTIVFSLDIKFNATGLVINDWKPGGQYQVIGSWFSQLDWPAQPLIAFSLVWVWIMLMILIRNTLVLNPNYDLNAKFAFWPLRNYLLQRKKIIPLL